MNERWIEHKNTCYSLSQGKANREEWLDIIGLFETGWMVFEYEDRDDEIICGYPR